MTIDQLNLSAAAFKAAQALLAIHPEVVFTSGRRDIASQCRAMAANVLLNRQWIAETYKPSLASQECQAWLNENPSSNTAQSIYFGLMSVMTRMPIAEAGKISKHLSGDAFDVQPVLDKDGKVTPQGLAVIAAIKALPGLTKFLDHEGGLVRWHAQFA